jgi:hypothetical protein
VAIRSLGGTDAPACPAAPSSTAVVTRAAFMSGRVCVYCLLRIYDYFVDSFIIADSKIPNPGNNTKKKKK